MAGALHILSLADGGLTRCLNDADFRALGRRFGRPVFFEQMAVPPAPILLSDLMFLRQHGRRYPPEATRPLRIAAAKLAAASLIMIDDVAELSIGQRQVVGALSHELRRDERADWLAVRGQPYAAQHHRLPITVVAGSDLAARHRTGAIATLSRFLNKPIFRVATCGLYQEHTRDWDLIDTTHPFGTGGGLTEVFEGEALARAIGDWIEARLPLRWSRKHEAAGKSLDRLGHYCSSFIFADRVKPILDHYRTFCIAGQASSVPAIPRYLGDRRFVRARGISDEALAEVAGRYQVVLACGPNEQSSHSRRIIPVMNTGRAMHVARWPLPSPPPPRFSAEVSDHPESGRDWHHDTPLDRSEGIMLDDTFVGIDREAAKAAAIAKRNAKLQARREARAVHQGKEVAPGAP